MAIIYKIATVKITKTLAIRGFAPPPLCYIVCSWYFPPFCFSFNIAYLEIKCKGEKKFYKNERQGGTEIKLQKCMRKRKFMNANPLFFTV